MIAALAVAGLLAADALALYTFGELLAGGYVEGHRETPAAVLFVVVAFLGYGVPRVLDLWILGARKRLAVSAVIGVLVLYAALRITFASDLALWSFGWVEEFFLRYDAHGAVIGPLALGGILLLGAWARGSWRSSGEVWLEAVPRSLAIPFGLVTVFVVLATFGDRTGTVARGAVAFYGVALATLACSQLALSGATFGDLRAGSVTGALLGATGGVTVLGVVVVGVVFSVLADLFGPVVTGPIADGVLWFVQYVIFFPVIWVIAQIVEGLFWLYDAILRGGGDEEMREPPPEQPQGQPGSGIEPASDSALRRIGRYLFAGGILAGGVVVAAIVIALAALRRHRGDTGRDESVESEQAGGLGEDLRAALGLFRRGRSSRPPAGEGAVRLYLEVLQQAERSGVERPASRTASEFAPNLSSAFHTGVTDEITRAFEHARYAGRDPDPAALDDLRRRWREAGA